MNAYFIHNFGPNLKRLRQQYNISQTDLAEHLQIGKQSLSDYEHRKSFPTFANLDKIACYFNVDANQLFGEINNAPITTNYNEEHTEKMIAFLKNMFDFEQFLNSTDTETIKRLLERRTPHDL